MKRTSLAIIGVILFLLPAAESSAEEPSTGLPNLPTPTLGGKQFWTDVHFFHQWHIQRNAVTGHYRLLDGDGQRQAWGSLDECRNALTQIRSEQKLPPMEGTAVILLHGLFRTPGSLEGLDKYLVDRGRYMVIRPAYGSTRADLDAHAAALDDVIASLEGVTKIHLVAHSLGNLVIRRYLHMTTDPQTGRQGDPRLGRIVMLAPPNQGTQLGQKLIPLDFTKSITGEAAHQLASDWENLAPKLATPQIEFGILSGGKGDDAGYNPLLDGDDDMVVEVATTQLPGAKDFRVVPALHSFIMDEPTVQQMTHRFLEHGYFETAERAVPLR